MLADLRACTAIINHDLGKDGETFGGHRRYYSQDEEVVSRHVKEERCPSFLVLKEAMSSLIILETISPGSLNLIRRLDGKWSGM
jgi:hypothetical protein